MSEPRRDDAHPRNSANDLSGTSRDVVQAGSVSGGIHFHHAEAAGHGTSGPTPRQLPADIQVFVNRTDELCQLNAVLPGRGGGRLVVCLCVIAGTAGAGKTSLALRWSHQVQDEFPDGQLYVNLRGYDPGEPVTARQALRGFLRALGASAADIPQDVDDAAALYRSLLADRRVLILLDNAATVGQVRPLLPGSGGSLVVVTSRSRLSSLAVRDGARRLTLGTLHEPEAVALLRAVTRGFRPEDDESALRELAQLCARLPLALRIAAERAASHPHLRLDDLIADLRDESALWDALSTGDDDEADAVRTVFTWSYRALSPPAAHLFCLLGLHPGPEFALRAAAALADLGVGRARQLLDDLVGAHLLEQTAPDRYQFHDLLRAYAADQAIREEPPQQRDAALRRVLDWYLHTADSAATWIEPDEEHIPLAEPAPGAGPMDFADYDGAVDWSEREYTNLRHAAGAAAAAGLDQLTWQLAAVLWNALPPSASLADWLDTGRAGLAAAARSDDRRAQAFLLLCLGMAYRSANRLDDALDCLRQALDISRSLGNRHDEADALNLVGLIHLRTRRLDAAAELFEEAAGIFLDEGNTRGQAVALSNLATTLLDCGRLPAAYEAAERALAMHRSAGNERSEGGVLREMAELHREQGDLDTALQEAQDAVDIALRLRHHRLEGYWLLTLGNCRQAAGQYAAALTSYQRSAMLHRRLGDRSREALAWRGTGETCLRLDRPEEAASFHREAAAVHRELGDAWNHALDLAGLADALIADAPEAARGHWAEALVLLGAFDDSRALRTREFISRRLDE
ncbi:hypothetical protein QR77_26850 [Streptomyces sp. 150FB]|uniref:ATP-binding protein n=1 Tax=Streptomyces sp. 150FB TaxID=1576605 RepID=UPI0005896B13|nr:hypothetical protein QR77_26850 [Streptomyces sp. 150FB]